MKIVCAFCGSIRDKRAGDVNRAKAAGLKLYCGRLCSGFGRRSGKTKAQMVAEKSAYDARRRVVERERLKVMRAESFRRNYDPVKAAEYRKKRMPRHVEYCRRPYYRAKKAEYDRHHRAEEYGPFADCFLLIQDINREVLSRMSRYEIDLANDKLNKTTKRRRADARTFRC